MDGSGNVYVSGMTQTSVTNSDFILIKYNSSGTQQWLATYNGTGNSFDSGSDIYVDASGNVYLTGSGYNASGNTDVITLKYNSSGTQQWVKYLNYNGNDDVGVKIAPYGTSVLVAVIAQYNTNSYYYGLLQYAMSNGTLTNSSITGSSSTNMDVISDMVVDASGYIYISGSAPVSGQGYDYSLIKLNVNLGVAWERNYNGNDNLNDYAKGLRVDASGNVYVTGYSETDTTGKDIVTLKYNSSGTLQWTETYNNELDGDDEAYAIAMDNSGKIYVTGNTSTENDQLDVFTIKYDASGNEVWKINSDGPYHLNDKATNIAIDSNGDIIVAAASETAPGQYQYLTVKYVEKDIIIPTDFNEEEPNNNFVFYKNSGQIVDTDGDPVSSVNYYNKNSYPEFYFQSRSHSMVFSSIDTSTSSQDTLHRIDVTFPKGNATAKTYSMDQKKEYNNYYLGQCPEGIAHVYGNQKLVVTNIFDNIDLIYSSNQNGMKYYFVVKPGGDPDDIEMVFTGADAINIDGTTNDLTIQSSVGNLVYERPTAYQVDQNNDVVAITGWNCAWQSVNATCKDFYTGSYNTSLPLIIQVDMGHEQFQATQALGNLLWSTYYGGAGYTQFFDVCNDNNNYTYITGGINYSDFPISAGYSVYSYQGSLDAIVIKIDENIEQKWVTYIGGRYGSEFEYENEPVTNPANDFSYAITCNPTNGSIYIAGKTFSTDFPTKDDFYPVIDDINSCSGNYADIFITQLKASGDILWSTLYGGDENEVINDLVMSDQNLYAVGERSASTDIVPLTGATNYQNGNGLVMKLTNNVLTWANPFDVYKIRSICKDNSGNIYFTGDTRSNTTPVLNNDESVLSTSSLSGGTSDAFITMFNSNGVLKYSMYYGSSCYDKGYSVIANSTGKIFVAGLVTDNTGCGSLNNYSLPLLPSSNQVIDNETNDTPEAFIFSVDPYVSGDANISYSTYYGGGSGEGSSAYLEEFGMSLAIDNMDNIYMAGLTCSSSESSYSPTIPFPQTNDPSLYVLDDLQNLGSTLFYDAYITSFSPQMDLLWTTYFGGFNLDKPTSVSMRPDQKLMFVGFTYSRNELCPIGENILELVNYDEFSNFDYYQNSTLMSYPAWAAMFDVSNISVGISVNNKDISILNISPNPASEYISIYWKNNLNNNLNKNINYQIIDNLGKIVESGKITNVPASISVRTLREGLYTIKMQFDNGYENHKFIISK